MLNSSVMETIRFYADSGDLPTAAHIALIFYKEMDGKPTKFFTRILKSYF